MAGLHVQDAGSGVPVVFLHSSGLSGRQWRRLAASVVEAGLRAVVPDLSGHGQSAEWPEPMPFTFAVDTAHVLALLQGLGRPAHLVGHSYGGFIALLAAVAAPRQVLSLAVYDPVALGTLDAPEDADARADVARVGLEWDGSPEGRERWLTAFVDYWMGPGAWAGLRDDARGEFRRVAWVVYEGVRTLAHDSTTAAAYRVIDAPVLLLGGASSPLAARRVIERLALSIPGARAEPLPGAGHMGPLTHADVLNPRLVRWLRTSR